MRQRSFSLVAALGLLASLAIGSSGKAATIPFTYTTSVDTNPVLTAMNLVGPVSSPAPTVSTVSGGTGSGAIMLGLGGTPAEGAAISFAIGNYTLANVPGANSYYMFGGTTTETVNITIGGPLGGTGSLTINEAYNGVVGNTVINTITPSISPAAPGHVLVGAYDVSVFYTATSTTAGHPGSNIMISLQAVLTPEPTSMALLGIGMAGFIAFRKYFKRPMVA